MNSTYLLQKQHKQTKKLKIFFLQIATCVLYKWQRIPNGVSSFFLSRNIITFLAFCICIPFMVVVVYENNPEGKTIKPHLIAILKVVIAKMTVG